ncbi:MAG: IS1595 family transposase [Leptolyngbya sp. SIO1D8]|nr:IS1595 family transposase [Leptolyngbya sp. SIO1D8]
MTLALHQVKSLPQAIVYFSDPENCLNYLVSKRWPNGVACPHCGHNKFGFISTRRVFKCKHKECCKQFSIKVGTIMEDSPLGLDKWLIAIWLIVNAKNGISSCEIARSLDITQKSAWFLLHRIRLALQNGSLEKLDNAVEADETFIGGKARNMHKDKREDKIKGRGASGKTIVLGALERTTHKKISQVKTRVIKERDKQTLKAEISQMVEKGSILYTDGHDGYDSLNAEYVRLVVDHAEKYVDGTISTNGIENYWTLLKRALKGTYVSVEPFHLFRSLDEQSFRFNTRDGNDRDRFEESLTSIAGRRITYS